METTFVGLYRPHWIMPSQYSSIRTTSENLACETILTSRMWLYIALGNVPSIVGSSPEQYEESIASRKLLYEFCPTLNIVTFNGYVNDIARSKSRIVSVELAPGFGLIRPPSIKANFVGSPTSPGVNTELEASRSAWLYCSWNSRIPKLFLGLVCLGDWDTVGRADTGWSYHSGTIG